MNNPPAPPPSLFGGDAQVPQLVRNEYGHQARTLLDLLHDAFYLLLLLKNGHGPQDAGAFVKHVRSYLDGFDRHARRLGTSADDIFDAKYAVCAAVDEAVLASDFEVRQLWERAPLQLLLFGEQTAGETFFRKLEQVRQQGAPRLQVLEIYYMCLLTGYQGKYRLESPEKLNYLISMLDKELAHLRGKRAAFAPDWKSPDQVRHLIRAEVPVWAISSVFVLFGALSYLGFNWMLAGTTNSSLAPYYDIIKLAPKVPSLTISLP